MRRLKRNQTEITYCLITGQEKQKDSSGYSTGRNQVTYGEPVTLKACVVFHGTSSYKPYGIDEGWSVVIIPDNPIEGITVGTKFTINSKDYFVLAYPTTMNEQRIYCK